MRDNPIQFAVVREDPRLVGAVIDRYACRRPLLVASGGCTALTLAAKLPDLELVLVDPNPAQLGLVRAKLEALRTSGEVRLRSFNVDDEDPAGLSQCGNFESLFRGLRAILHEHVLPAEVLASWFTVPGLLARERARLLDHRFWRAAFEAMFSDGMLVAMFGPEAVQHATPGSYPAYFERAFRRGLERDDAFDNPFLHHALLGHYVRRDAALPPFLLAPAPTRTPTLVEATFEGFEDFSPFDLVDLSNVPDWMSKESAETLFLRLVRELRSGAVVLWRQLNNQRDLAGDLRGAFSFDRTMGSEWLERDRSLFYASVHIGMHE